MNSARSMISLGLAMLILLTGTVVGATPAQAASSITCANGTRTYGWVTSPVDGQTVGARRCQVMTLGSLNGEYAYWFKSSVSGAWIPTSNNAQNMGGPPGSAGRAHADAAKALAAKHGMKLHITKYVGYSDRVGWMYRDGRYGFHGVYYPSPQKPGKGLIEISAGGGNLGVADATRGKAFMRQAILDPVRHEVSHGRIELKCGTWTPKIAGDRVEQVTEAYAHTFLGKKSVSYTYTASDVRKARAIASGNCG